MKILRSRFVLLFALVLASAVMTWWLAPETAKASLLPGVDEACLYAGQEYSLGACRSGQRCRKNDEGEYYWSDDSNCNPISSGANGGRPPV